MRRAGAARARHAGGRSSWLPVVLAVLATAGVLTAPWALLRLDGDVAPSAVPAGTTASCPRAAPLTAAGYQAAFDAMARDHCDEWCGGDQTSSTPLPDGRVLWLFGDTLQGSLQPDGSLARARLVRNTFVLQQAGCFAPVTGPAGQAVVSGPDQATWYWPQQAFADADRLWVTALRVGGAARSAWDFTILGVDLVEFRVPPGGAPQLLAVHQTPASTSGPDGVLWGVGLLRHGPTVYMYGTRTSAGAPGRELLLARVPVAWVADVGAWQFRTSVGWSPRPEDATVIVPADPGVSTAVSSLSAADRAWVIITKRGEFLAPEVIALVAPTPWGPWREQRLFAAPTTPRCMVYLPMAHSECRLSHGRLLVTVNRNAVDLSGLPLDPRLYRPVFRSVPMPGSP